MRAESGSSKYPGKFKEPIIALPGEQVRLTPDVSSLLHQGLVDFPSVILRPRRGFDIRNNRNHTVLNPGKRIKDLSPRLVEIEEKTLGRVGGLTRQIEEACGCSL
jgi:hypothetical protein